MVWCLTPPDSLLHSVLCLVLPWRPQKSFTRSLRIRQRENADALRARTYQQLTTFASSKRCTPGAWTPAVHGTITALTTRIRVNVRLQRGLAVPFTRPRSSHTSSRTGTPANWTTGSFRFGMSQFVLSSLQSLKDRKRSRGAGRKYRTSDFRNLVRHVPFFVSPCR